DRRERVRGVQDQLRDGKEHQLLRIGSQQRPGEVPRVDPSLTADGDERGPDQREEPDHGQDQDQDNAAALCPAVRMITDDARAITRRHHPAPAWVLVGGTPGSYPRLRSTNQSPPRVETRGTGFMARSADPQVFLRASPT